MPVVSDDAIAESRQLTVKQLATRLAVMPTDIIKALLKRGIMATLNQQLDDAIVGELTAFFRADDTDDTGDGEIQGGGVPRPRPTPGQPGTIAVPLEEYGDDGVCSPDSYKPFVADH